MFMTRCLNVPYLLLVMTILNDVKVESLKNTTNTTNNDATTDAPDSTPKESTVDETATTDIANLANVSSVVTIDGDDKNTTIADLETDNTKTDDDDTKTDAAAADISNPTNVSSVITIDGDDKNTTVPDLKASNTKTDDDDTTKTSDVSKTDDATSGTGKNMTSSDTKASTSTTDAPMDVVAHGDSAIKDKVDEPASDTDVTTNKPAEETEWINMSNLTNNQELKVAAETAFSTWQTQESCLEFNFDIMLAQMNPHNATHLDVSIDDKDKITEFSLEMEVYCHEPTGVRFSGSFHLMLLHKGEDTTPLMLVSCAKLGNEETDVSNWLAINEKGLPTCGNPSHQLSYATVETELLRVAATASAGDTPIDLRTRFKTIWHQTNVKQRVVGISGFMVFVFLIFSIVISIKRQIHRDEARSVLTSATYDGTSIIEDERDEHSSDEEVSIFDIEDDGDDDEKFEESNNVKREDDDEDDDNLTETEGSFMNS